MDGATTLCKKTSRLESTSREYSSSEFHKSPVIRIHVVHIYVSVTEVSVTRLIERKGTSYAPLLFVYYAFVGVCLALV